MIIKEKNSTINSLQLEYNEIKSLTVKRVGRRPRTPEWEIKYIVSNDFDFKGLDAKIRLYINNSPGFNSTFKRVIEYYKNSDTELDYQNEEI